jgi:hypothetical protein
VSLRDAFEKMSPREQRLLSLLGVVAGLLLFVGGPFLAYRTVAADRRHNEDIRTQLQLIEEGGELLALRRAEREQRDLRYAKEVRGGLSTFIDGAAKENHLALEGTKPLPDLKGKGYVERIVEVKLKKVEKIERSGHALAITELSIRTRGADSYDVEMSVSHFEKEAAVPKAGATASAAPRKAPAPSDEEETP